MIFKLVQLNYTKTFWFNKIGFQWSVWGEMKLMMFLIKTDGFPSKLIKLMQTIYLAIISKHYWELKNLLWILKIKISYPGFRPVVYQSSL